MTTKIQIKTTSYNQRRYSKPWIAIVDFSKNPKGDYKWGSWVGDSRTGSDGLLVVEANEGDIICWGQKDFRGNNSGSFWYQVRDGEAVHLPGKVEAYKLAIAN